MGNTQSEVTAGAKKQADFDPTTTKIYSLVDLKKGGILVDIMREAFRSRDFSRVDDKLREIVTPFLYNQGRGKMIPISRIIRMRNKERPASKRLASGRGKEQEGDEDDREEQAKLLLVTSSLVSSFDSVVMSSRVGSMEEGDAMPGSVFISRQRSDDGSLLEVVRKRSSWRDRTSHGVSWLQLLFTLNFVVVS